MDYQRALSDGHSPEDVMGELAKRGVKMDYKRAIADGHDPLEVLKEMNGREPGRGKTPTTPAAPTAPQHAPKQEGSFLGDIGDTISRKWSKFKAHPVTETLSTAGQVAAEIPQVLGEAVTAPVSAVNKLAAGAGTLAGGGSTKQAYDAYHESGLESPLGKSWTGKAVGNYTGRLVNKVSQDLDLPNLPKVAEVVGDLLALSAVKPGTNALTKGAGVVKNKLATGAEQGFLPYGKKRAEYKAGQKFNNLSNPLSTEHAMTQATDVADAQALNQRIMEHRPPEQRAAFTPGELGMPQHAVNEMVRRTRSKDPTHAIAAELNDNTLAAAARESVDRAIPGETGEGARTVRDRIKADAAALTGEVEIAGQAADAAGRPLAATDSPQTVGERITDTLTTKRTPEKAAKKAAYDEVDALGYEMKFPNYEKHVGELEASAATEADPAIKNVIGIVKGTLEKAKSTSGYDAVYKTLNSYIRDFQGSKTPGASRAVALLQKAKDALRSDAEAFSKAVEAGDVAIHEKRIVRPSEVKAEITTLEKRLADGSGKAAGTDTAAMAAKLKESGDTSTMKMTGEKPDGYTARLEKQWKRRFPNEPVPSVSAVDPKIVADIKAAIAAKQKQLTELQPAEDFATKYKRATTLASEEADRYGKGASDEVFRQGKEASGQRLPAEKLPAKFETESGAEDLARSLSDSNKRDARGKLEITDAGRKAAGDLMRDHFADKAATMLDNPKKLTAWLNSPKVKPVLQKLGLYDEFSNVSRAKQTVAAAQSTLEQFQKSTVGKIMEMDPDTIVGWIHKQTDPAAAMREVLAYGKGNPSYKAGLQVAVRDWVMTSGEVSAEDMLGFNKTTLSKSKKLTVARTKRMLHEVFDGKQRDALSDFHETIRNLSRNKTSPHGAQSATSFLQSKEMGQVGYGVARDVLRYAGGAVVNTGANVLRHFMKGMIEEHGEMIEQFVDQAALNPKDGRLLNEAFQASQTKRGVSEAMCKQIAARVRGYAKQATVRGAAGAAVSQGATDQWGTDDSEPIPRADGGPVVPGQKYLTGENQPETLLNADGTQQILGVAGPQVITPQQPGMVQPSVPAPATLTPEQLVLQQVLNENKGLAKIHNKDNTSVIFADPDRTNQARKRMGNVGLEYWPDSEGGTKDWPHPSKGKNILEIYGDDLKKDPAQLKQALYGDMIHGMNRDPQFKKLRDEFMKNFTPEEQERIKRKRAWWEDVNGGGAEGGATYDAYVRGWLGADAKSAREGQTKSGNTMYSKKQLEILKKMEKYIKTGDE